MKLLDGIRNYFQEPKQRQVYAVTNGDYLGEFLVYMDEQGGVMNFLSLPDVKIRNISRSDVMSGIRDKVLDKVEMLPRDVYSVCLEQYKQTNKYPVRDENVPSNDTVRD